MLLGFNFTQNDTLDMVRRLVDEKRIDFCEVLIDNFLHVPPEELMQAFECPLGFHIMFSKFLEADSKTLEDLAKRLRVYIDALQPLYVSDHVARFEHRGRLLYHLGEIDYLNEYQEVRARVERWQDLLGQRLYLENYPSIMDGGWDAPAFYERLTRESGAGVLFDASNVVCAMHNCGLPLDAWDDILSSARHFHVAGYRTSFSEPCIILDSHDGDMAHDTLDYLAARRHLFDKRGATLTYERDFNIDFEAVAAELTRLREVFCDAEGSRNDLALRAS